MHTMWKGSISFGLVNIPIKMFAATEEKDVRFRYLHKECMSPIKYQKVCPVCDKEIKDEEIVRGYEYEPSHFIIVDENELNSLKSEVNGRNIEILDFVNLSEIDPIYFEKTYYLSPQENGGKAYSLLEKAMLDTGKIAIARITIRNKQSLACLRVSNEILVMETIFYPDEVRPVSQVPGLPEKVEINEKELDIATKLIESLTASFEPEKYKDNYREALNELINKKIAGKEIEVSKVVPQRNVIDLMEALQASLKESQKKGVATKKSGKKTAKSDKEKKTATV
ncbi:MAG: Ku protein [Firmicutes bacterium HGW-Firmicutes-12]|nr:MAG: Ku protein [Firmicutes bacterium HGW-Firmicutes-12]